MTLFMTQADLEDLPRQTADHCVIPDTLRQIRRAVSMAFDVSESDLLSPRRSQRVVRPRHAGFWLCKKLTGRSYCAIARYWNRMDHTTIRHGISMAEIWRERDPEYKAKTDAIKEMFDE